MTAQPGVATTRYGIDLRVQLGIGRQSERGVWDQGRWGVNVWGQSDTSLGDWVDVTCDVGDPFELAAGATEAEGIVTRWEAATLSMTLWGDVYNPWQGPYAGIVGPLTAVRVLWRATGSLAWLPAFTGAVTADGWDWRPVAKGRDEVVVNASDMLQNLVAYTAVAGPVVGEGESAAARVNRWLDIAHWPMGARAVKPGGVKVQGTDGEGNVWSALQKVADTDLALLWLRRDGRVAYLPEGRVGEGVTLGARLVVCDNPDDATDIQVVTMGGAQVTDIRNAVTISREKPEGAPTDPVPATVVSDASIARYARRQFSETDLVHADDAWSAVIAGAVLASSAFPSSAPRSAVLDSRLGNRYVPALLLALEPDYAFDVVDNTGRVWLEGCVGWVVSVGVDAISGTVVLDDLTQWIAGQWDAAEWDRDRWGLAIPASSF